MHDSLKIESEMRESIPLLTVDYQEKELFVQNFSQVLADELKASFRKLVGSTLPDRAPCIVHIKASTAGSPLVRALFDLYKVVNASSGLLVCAEYPVEYMSSLTSLGLPILPGFRLANSLPEALEIARAHRDS